MADRPEGWVRPASAMYTAWVPSGVQTLVTIWGDGTAEIAIRLKESDTWSSPPTPMVREEP